MRIPIIAGNWKMNTTIDEARQLVTDMRPGLQALREVESVLCPPFISLEAVAGLLEGTSIGLGAQNMHWEEKGAFTGEIAPRMLAGLCQYVIIGHSERREFFGETDEGVNRKIKAALAHGLKPIVCVGENLAQNEAGRTEQVVCSQVRAAMNGLTPEGVLNLVIAYEPIWAIGTGKAATAAGAGVVIGKVIRGTLAESFGEGVAQRVRIQYGGSANAGNIGEFMAHPEIDGALVGGASLKADEFVRMVEITSDIMRAG